ncbi:MAG: adenylate cyclase [Ignavibacteriales bacterium]
MDSQDEIERKFLINEDLLPDLSQYEKKQIVQGYLSYEPEVRIRAAKQNGKSTYYLTKKGKGTLSRKENERKISACSFFNKLKRIDKESLIRKIRYEIPLGDGNTSELDFFQNPELKDYAGPNTGMHKTVEVEFSSIEASKSFNPPDWFGKEVTEIDKFKNNSISKFITAQKQR